MQLFGGHGFSKGGGAKDPSSCHSGAGGREAQRKLYVK